MIDPNDYTEIDFDLDWSPTPVAREHDQTLFEAWDDFVTDRPGLAHDPLAGSFFDEDYEATTVVIPDDAAESFASWNELAEG